MHGTCGYFYTQKLLCDVVSMATDDLMESNNRSVSQTLVPFTWCIVSPELCSCLDDLWLLLRPLICIWASGGSRLLSKICLFKVWSVSDCLRPAGVKKHKGLKLIHILASLSEMASDHSCLLMDESITDTSWPSDQHHLCIPSQHKQQTSSRRPKIITHNKKLWRLLNVMELIKVK